MRSADKLIEAEGLSRTGTTAASDCPESRLPSELIEVFPYRQEASLHGTEAPGLVSRLSPRPGSGRTGKVSTLIRTALCDLLGVEHPIIQAGMGPFAPASLAAAVCNAGGLGSIGTFGLDPINLVRPADDLDRQFTSIRELTDRLFANNFVVPYFEERAEQLMALFDRALSIQPAVVSFAMGDAGDLVR